MLLLAFTGDIPVKKPDLEGLHFQAALEKWHEMRYGKIAQRTWDDYALLIKILVRNFHAIADTHHFPWEKLLIDDIDGDWLRWYQRDRQAGPKTINKELMIVRSVRKRIAQLGGKPAITDYEALIVPKDWETPGRRLTRDEHELWEELCVEYADHPLWGVAALGTLINLKTGAGPGEVRSLKIKNVFPPRPGRQSWSFYVDRRGAKRIRRERTVVCKERAGWALEKLLKRANDLGATEPDHFLIPYHNYNHTYDPTEPGGDWRGGFKALQAIAETKFRNYDLRHTAISYALEDKQMTFAEAELYFGHIPAKMKNTYYHGTYESLEKVADAIARGQAKTKKVVFRKAVQKERRSLRVKTKKRA